MYFKVLTWENIGWEESTASSTRKLTRRSEKSEEKQRQKHWLLAQVASWGLWFTDKLVNIMPSWSMEEVSPSLKSERPVLHHNSPNQSELPLITEDITKTLIIKLLMLQDWPNTNPSSSYSQDMKVLPRRELLMIQLKNNWRVSRIKTPPAEFSKCHHQRRDARPQHSPRTFSHSEPTTLSDLPEPTRDMQVSEPREQRKPKIRRSELNVGHRNRARLYLQLIQFASLKSTKLYYAYILYGLNARKLMLLHFIFILVLLYDTRQINEQNLNEWLLS